jgi:hypothetical protein
MIVKQLFIFSILIGCGIVCFAQQPDVELFLERQDEYSDISDLLELLADLEKNPIELNHATIEQLILLPWISDVMARNIIQTRERLGGFQSIEQLALIDGIDAELLQILQSFITVSSPKSQDFFSIAAKTRISERLKKPEGIKRGIYSDSPRQIYNRYILQYQNKLSLGIVLEKDSGEGKLDDLRLYFFKYNDNSNQKKIILGNYRLEFGSGLIFGNPYYYSKGSNPIYSLKRQTKELIEYKIVDENASLYGIAGQVSFKSYQIFLFYSTSTLDASLNLDETVKNFYSSGYHRSDTEIEKKDQLAERLIGARVNVRSESNYSFGLTYYYNWFNRQFFLDSETQNFYPDYQKINAVIGADYNAIVGPFNFMGEAGRSRNGGYGFVAGVIMDANPLKLALLARSYARNFISDHGNSFSESNRSPRNEQGIYFGWQYKILKNLKLAFYFDQFKFPWSTYLIPLPSSGRELLFRIEHKPVRHLAINFQIKASLKDQAMTTLDAMNRTKKVILPRKQFNARFQIDYQPWENITIRHRLEKTWVSYRNYSNFLMSQNHHFQGIALYQDIAFKLLDNLTCTGRITFFDTDSYESRIYQYERDVPGSFTSQMLYDDGNRWYLTLDWKLKSLLRISFKFGSIHYYFFNSIGSGLDQVSGNTLNSMKVQFELNY